MLPASPSKTRFALGLTIAMLVSVVLHAPTVGDSLLIAAFGGGAIGVGEAVGIDFEVYRQAALRLEAGLPIYADPLFIYPPVFAHIWRWTIGTGARAYDVYRLLSWAVFVLTPLIAMWPYRVAVATWTPRARLLLGGALVLASTALDPLRLSYAMGNVDHFIVFGVLLAYAAYRADRPVVAGAIVGLAGALKLMPLMLVGVAGAGVVAAWLLSRRYGPVTRARVAFIVSAAAAAGLALGAFPEGLRDFVVHYPNVEADYRVFSLSAILTDTGWVAADVAPKINLLAGVVIAAAWGARHARDDLRMWSSGAIAVYLTNPRGNTYTLAILLVPMLALAFAGDRPSRLAAALLSATWLVGNLIAFGDAATHVGAVFIFVVCLVAGTVRGQTGVVVTST